MSILNRNKLSGGFYPPAFVFSLFMLFATEVLAQKVARDTLPNVDSISVPRHSPKKASLLSLVLPGAGQFYNHKYWKIPVIYTGFAVSGFFIYDNNKQFQLFRSIYLKRANNSADTANIQPEYKHLSKSQLDDQKEYYRYNRDLSIIIAAGIYIFNIIDAAVDAHLFYFDISDNLSLKLSPSEMYAAGFVYPLPALSCRLNFKDDRLTKVLSGKKLRWQENSY